MKILKTDMLVVRVTTETAFGVPEYPNTTVGLKLRDDIEFPSQAETFDDIVEVGKTLGVEEVMRALTDAGSIKFPVNLRPHLAPGYAPNETLFLLSILGFEEAWTYKTRVPVTPVSLTVWLEMEEVTLFLAGLIVPEGEFSQEGKNGAPKADFSCQFARLGHTGRSTLAVALDGGETEIEVEDAGQYSIGSRIVVGTSGAGYPFHTVTARDLTTNVLTLSEAIVGEQAEGAVVKPGTTSGPVDYYGAPIKARPQISIGGVSIPWKSWKVKVTNPVSFIADEVPADPTEAGYPTDYTMKPGRKVEASVVGYLRGEDLKRFNSSDEKVLAAIDFTPTAPAEQAVVFTMGSCQVGKMEGAKGDGGVERTINLRPLGAQDELTISYPT